jgi:hypothetical protein
MAAVGGHRESGLAIVVFRLGLSIPTTIVLGPADLDGKFPQAAPRASDSLAGWTQLDAKPKNLIHHDALRLKRVKQSRCWLSLSLRLNGTVQNRVRACVANLLIARVNK